MSEEKGKRLSTRRVYDGRIVKVDRDTVKLPNGAAVELEMIRHSGASAIVPFLSDPTSYDPQILLIRQYRYAADGFIYRLARSLVGGMVAVGRGSIPLAEWSSALAGTACGAARQQAPAHGLHLLRVVHRQAPAFTYL